MGFSQGTVDELLLTCIVCREPFGMTSQFCGECGANRLQALGVERASIQQKILPNVSSAPSYSQSVPSNSGQTVFGSTPAPQPTFTSQTEKPISRPAAPAKPKENVKKKERAFKKQIRKQDRQLRIDKINEWQDRKSPLVFSLGFISLLTISFVLTQSYIFANASPSVVADQYILDGTSRSVNYQNINNDVADAPDYDFFPAKYSNWSSSKAAYWSNEYSWNGWLGKASVNSIASGKRFADDVVDLQLKATYKKKWGIFREVEWVPADHAATLSLTYPSDKTLRIYINGFAAGTVGNPAIKAGDYYLYPGELNIVFYDKFGNKADLDQSFFVGLSGERSTFYD